jgi:hypothetical protein
MNILTASVPGYYPKLLKPPNKMTPRTLFTIVVKIFGLFFIKEIFQIITEAIPTLAYFNNQDITLTLFIPSAILILYLILYGGISYYLITRTELVIDKLKLDQGFEDETLQLSIHRSTILSIAIIVIGGLLMVEGIPTFLGQLKRYHAEANDSYRQQSPTFSYMIVTAAKILIGFLLIVEKRWIVNFIEKQRKK